MHRSSLSTRLMILGLLFPVLGLNVATRAAAQEKPGEAGSLARYIPKDNVNIYIESQGVEAHADSWKKTAAYKILINTTTGAMLEELGAQIYDKTAKDQIPNHGGKALVEFIEHFGRWGFVLAQVRDEKDPTKFAQVFVFRNAFKDVAMRESMKIELQSMNPPNTKPQSVTRVGHKIVTGVNKQGRPFAWWIEEKKKEDLVLISGAIEIADVILETLDAKRPNIGSMEQYADFFKPQGSFEPTGVAWLTPQIFKSAKIPPALGLANISKFDFRWGFQDDALMTVTRIATSGPRTGVLGLLEGSNFDKSKMPIIPENVGEFTVISLDPKTLLDKLVAIGKSLKPDFETQFNGFVDSIKTTTKLRLKEDILSHIGPKMAFYSLPAKAGAKPAAGPSGMMGMVMSSMGTDQVPRAAIVIDIDNAAAFGKVLDQVMTAVNKELKSQAAKAAGVEVAAGKGARNRGPSVPSPEFRLMPGDAKMYVLNVPADLASQYPPSFRPAIRVGPKHAVIGVTSEVARLVLETKGTWTAPGDLAPAFQSLSSDLKVLNVSDPRDTLPGILASLPGNLQKAINIGMQLKGQGANGMAAAIPTAPAQPGAPGTNNSGGKFNKLQGLTPGGNPGGGAGGPAIVAATPGGTGPSAPGAPGTSTTPGNIVLQVDAAKLPSADSIKSLLYPSVFTVETKDEEIRIVTRDAFPAIPDFAKIMGYAQLGILFRSGGASMSGMPGVPAGNTKAPAAPGGKPAGGGGRSVGAQ